MNYLCNAMQFSTSTELWISFFILIWFSCRNYLAIVSYHWKDHWGIIDIRESICAGGRASPEVYIWSARATTIPPRVVQQCYNHPSRVVQQCYNYPSECYNNATTFPLKCYNAMCTCATNLRVLQRYYNSKSCKMPCATTIPRNATTTTMQLHVCSSIPP